MSIYDYSEAVFGYLLLHPYLTVLVLEPLIFLHGINLGAHGLRRSIVSHPLTSMKCLILFESLISYISGGFCIFLGLGIGCVAAKGQGASVTMLFVFAPLVSAATVYRSFIKWKYRRTVRDYIANI